MSVGRFLQQGAAGNAGGDPVYVEDVFSNNSYQGVQHSFNVNGTAPLSTYDGKASYMRWDGTNDYALSGFGPNSAQDCIWKINLEAASNNVGTKLLKFTKDGDIAWYKDFPSGVNAQYQFMGDPGSTNFYLALRDNSSGSNRQVLAKIDTNGDHVWAYDLDSVINLVSKWVHVDSSGNAYWLIQDTSSTLNIMYLIKFDSSGSLQWQKSLSNATDHVHNLQSVVTDSSGNIYVGGYNYTGTALQGKCVIKLNSSGVFQWASKLENSSSTGFGLAVDNNDDVYITGRNYDSTYTNFWMSKFNSSGALQWSKDLRDSQAHNTRSGAFYSDGVVYGVSTTGETTNVIGLDTNGNLVSNRAFGTKEALQGGMSNPSFSGTSDGTLFMGAGQDKPTSSQYSPVVIIIQKFKDFIGDFGNTTIVPAGGTFADAGITAASKTVTVSDTSFTFNSLNYTWSTTAASEQLEPEIDITIGPTESDGGMVWQRHRFNDANRNHVLVDSVRKNASGYHKEIYTNLQDAEYDPGTTLSNMAVSSFNPAGFTAETSAQVNRDNVPTAAWVFRKHPGFFDVVEYTGNGSGNLTVPHSLGSEPGFIMIKCLDRSNYWAAYHRSIPTQFLTPNRTDAASNTQMFPSVSDTTFTVGQYERVNNSLGERYIAYLWAHDDQRFGTDGDESVVKCGIFTTDGSGNALVDVGFEPAWLLAKKTSSSGGWAMFDLQRGFSYDSESRALVMESNAAEVDNTLWHHRQNGFSLVSGGANLDFVYVAIRGPHKPASNYNHTELYQTALGDIGASRSPKFRAPFSPDMFMYGQPTVGGAFEVLSKLTYRQYMNTNSSNAEVAESKMVGGTSTGWGFNNGVYPTGAVTLEQAWMFRRAPGFFDIVLFEGDGGSTKTIPHNLGVVPEMMWVKRRDSSDVWWVYHKDMDATPHNAYLRLENTAAVVTNNNAGFGNTAPTADEFTVGGFAAASGTKNIAYLWASSPGQCTLGTYTGDNTTDGSKTIDCGFQPRFVVIKKATGVGHWFVYDTERGILPNANDYQLRLNATGAQTNTQDKIDPTGSGFAVKNNAGSVEGRANENNQTYIFLAIR